RLEGEDVLANRRHAAANFEMSKANLLQAKAELTDARTSFEREKALLGQGYTTQAAYDAADARHKKAAAAFSGAEAAVEAGAAALRAADVSVEYTVIRAPFDGVVLTKNADVGDIITPLGAAANAKSAVVTIADMGSLQVEVDVSESNIGHVKIGQPCEIQLDAIPDRRFRGRVHMIVPTADRAKASVLVKAAFIDIDKRVIPEMSAKAAFLQREATVAEQTPVIAISPSAVVKRNGRDIVFLVRGDYVIEKTVVIGERIGDLIEIKDGLKAGEKIAVKPLDKLKNNAKIKVIEK
ncbi:MAG: efflux RND transporter periplasmic adaptor subunit, partial [Nitrospirae bacterium]|nr:efflux RND transporter periplasmic adaptor subunit [Nitrospirota bacterium]